MNNRTKNLEHIEIEVLDVLSIDKCYSTCVGLNPDGTIEEPIIGDVCQDFNGEETDILKEIVAEMLTKGNATLRGEAGELHDGYFELLAEVSKAHLQGVLTAYYHEV